MKRIVMFVVIAVMSVAVMAQEPTETTRSRGLSMTSPKSGYVLTTDGKMNLWTRIKILLSGDALTVSKQTGAVTASGENNLVAPTATVTKQVGAITLSITPQYGIPTDAPMTNVLITVVGGGAVMTNATVAITPNLASNAVVAVSVTGGSAVMTNAAVSVP